MKVKHGKLLTKARQRLVRDYVRRRLRGDGNNFAYVLARSVPFDQFNKFKLWVNDFERFMLHGCADRARSGQVGAPPDRG